MSFGTQDQLVKNAIASHWRALLIEGVILVILGVAAVLLPQIASIALAVLLGWIFLVGGGVGAITTFAARGMPGFWWSLLSAVVTIIAGVMLIGWPVGGAISLTLVLAGFLVADGVLTILFGLGHRQSRRWGWLVTNGVLDLFLAAIIIWGLPASGVWVLGLIVGIDLLFGGGALIMLAVAARTA
jgi:uncharacterized membrane protein HdeD (DUF308 family)